MKREETAAPDLIHALDSTASGKRWPEHHDPCQNSECTDHFVERHGIQYAGTHLFLDFWGARHLDNLQRMEKALRECVHQCGATLLHIHLHHFTPNGGISGVAVLAESHISVHTWAEREFAAFDIFMCGEARPEEAIAILMRAFSPKTMKITEALRGAGGHA
jgi:S-adenosylmethionine decarboxylase